MKKIIRIHDKDNVAVALQAVEKGEKIEADGFLITAQESVLPGHKIALVPIEMESPVIKYGSPIGFAKKDIVAGQWVHTHNVKSGLGEILDYNYTPDFEVTQHQTSHTFMGYKRKNGSVGIRNEVWIVPTVGCVNAIARCIETAAQQEFMTDTIDGIYAYSHPHGCSQLGEDHHNTQKILSGLIKHPNAGAVLVLGLGCENNQIDAMKKILGDYDETRVKFLVCQEHEDEVAVALSLMKELCAYAAAFKREPCSVEELVIGLKCGGSDGFSGISANPLVGQLSNQLIAEGGTSILTEVPEMFGAETLLMNRCKDEVVFNKTVQLINHFKEYFMRYGEKINENPSPGNKKGGITTLEDKSLGCVQKGGSAVIEDVLGYGERVISKGLNLLQAPGNDLVAANALAASGAHIVLFTTGRGTPFACPVPTIKISSNSALANFKKNWIDFDAGVLLQGKKMNEVEADFFEFVLQIASGTKRAKSEALDKHELVIFKDGVTL